MAVTLKMDTDWKPLETEWEQLLTISPQQFGFEEWLERWSNLEGKLSSLETELRRRQYANTADKAAATGYAAFTERLMPKVHSARKHLVERYVADAPDKTGYLWQRFSAEQQLHTHADPDLLARERLLANRFNMVMGGLTVEWEGQSLPVSKLVPIQVNPDRNVREAAWRAEMEAKRKVADELTEMYLELARLRERIAHRAGFANYLEYRWLERGRFGYTPQECLAFARGVARHFGPLQHELTELRREKLGIDHVRPWDLSADLEGRAALKPYQSLEELVSKTKQVLRPVDPRLEELLGNIQAQGNLEIEARPNKSPGLFTDFYYDCQEALIFMSANGTPGSVSNLIHEFGHCNHWVNAARSQSHFWQQCSPIEVFETTAQALELVALDHLSPFFSDEEIERVKVGRGRAILFLTTLMLTREVFQHWVYTQPAQNLSPDLLTQQYRSITQEFGQPSDFMGLEEYQAFGWQSSFVFSQPLYAIEYSLAWVGALMFYQRYLQEPGQAWEDYQNTTCLGMSESASRLLTRLCGNNPMGEEQIARAAGFLRERFANAFGK